MPWIAWLMLACILDRTGQSATQRMQRELMDHRTRIQNIERQFIQVEARVNQLEELTHSRGKKELMQLENLDELQSEVVRLRGEVEVMSHATGQGAKELQARAEDATFRIMWLEDRADQLERALGLKTPDAPTLPSTTDMEEGTSTWTGEIAEGGEGTLPPPTSPRVVTIGESIKEPVLDAAQLLESAKAQLAKDNPAGAEAMLNRFLEQFPNHARSGEATYRLAEAAFNAKKYQEAVLRFQAVIDQYKASPYSSWAMLRQGECFEAQGQADNARVFYSEVVRIWPKSRAAKSAREKLGR